MSSQLARPLRADMVTPLATGAEAASSTIGHGNSSFSSHSSAAGRTTDSAKSWTHFLICSWSSLRARLNSGIG